MIDLVELENMNVPVNLNPVRQTKMNTADNDFIAVLQMLVPGILLHTFAGNGVPIYVCASPRY